MYTSAEDIINALNESNEETAYNNTKNTAIKDIIKLTSAYAYVDEKDNNDSMIKDNIADTFDAIGSCIQSYDNLICDGLNPDLDPIAFTSVYKDADAIKDKLDRFMINVYHDSKNPYSHRREGEGYTQTPTNRPTNEVSIQNNNKDTFETIRALYETAQTIEPENVREAMYSIHSPKDVLIAAHQKDRLDLGNTMEEQYTSLTGK